MRRKLVNFSLLGMVMMTLFLNFDFGAYARDSEYDSESMAYEQSVENRGKQTTDEDTVDGNIESKNENEYVLPDDGYDYSQATPTGDEDKDFHNREEVLSDDETSNADNTTSKQSINDYILSSQFKPATIKKDERTYQMFNYAGGKPQGVVIHETANPNSTIEDEIAYMDKNWQSAFVHAFADSKQIIQIHDTDYGSWGAGPIANSRFVQIELVRSKTREDFAKSVNNQAYYAAYMLDKYGLKPKLATGSGSGTIWAHDDVSKYLGGTDHSDPVAYFASWGYSMQEFYQLVLHHYQGLTVNDELTCQDTGNDYWETKDIEYKLGIILDSKVSKYDCTTGKQFQYHRESRSGSNGQMSYYRHIAYRRADGKKTYDKKKEYSGTTIKNETIYEYDYNTLNEIDFQYTRYSGGKLEYYKRYQHDKNGNLAEFIEKKYSGGKLIDSLSYIYNPSNGIREKYHREMYDASTGKIRYYRHICNRKTDGILTYDKKQEYSGTIIKTETIYEYDYVTGVEIDFQYTRYKNGKKEYYKRYIHDAFGNLLEKIEDTY